MAEKEQAESKSNLADPEEEVKGNWAKVVSFTQTTNRSIFLKFQ